MRGTAGCTVAHPRLDTIERLRANLLVLDEAIVTTSVLPVPWLARRARARLVELLKRERNEVARVLVAAGAGDGHG